MESYEYISYKIRGIANARTQSMVHFKQFLELMENPASAFTEPMEVLVNFVHANGLWDAGLATNYGCPLDQVIPLFTSLDETGFSMLHGVYKIGGGAWDSESN